MENKAKEETDNFISKDTNVRFKRPPDTVDETLQTLKEADLRYEASKHFLSGSLD